MKVRECSQMRTWWIYTHPKREEMTRGNTGKANIYTDQIIPQLSKNQVEQEMSFFFWGVYNMILYVDQYRGGSLPEILN